MKETPARKALAEFLDEHIDAMRAADLVPVTSGEDIVEQLDTDEGMEVLRAYYSERTKESVAALGIRIQKAMKAFTEPVQ